jgi:gliding motility-associated-like protein
MLQKLIAPLALLNKRIFLTIALLISCVFVSGQITINAPTLGFSQVCASTTFNSYNLSFSFSPTSNLGAGNMFTIELSNASGSFSSPTVLTTSTATTSPVSVSFAFPTDVNGTSYRIRIKSSAPVSTSLTSISFAANYAVYNQPFTINNNVSNQAICSTSNFNLTVDSGANSPLNFSQLIYKWYRNNVVISGQTSSSLPITQAGNYYVRVDYGTCVLNAYSNVVTISITQSETLTITPQGNSTSICPSTGLLINSAIASSGYTYQWYKNTIPISGETNSTYTAITEGDYYVIASNTICNITSNTLTLNVQTINVSLDSGAEINLLPGQTKTINCTTNAVNPTYIWYKNNAIISGQTTSSLNVTSVGAYKVKVKQNTGCVIEKEVSTQVTAPTSYAISIINSTTYLACEKLSETLSINTFDAIASLGTISIPSNIGVTYKWYKNNIEISGANSETYTVSGYVNSGTYRVEANFTDDQIVVSNNIDVKLKINEPINIITDGNILCNTNTSVTLSSSVTNSLFTYKWFKENESTVLGTNTTYEATEIGNYFLTISFFGCETSSNTITVESIDNSILITNYDENIIINEGGEVTIIASGVDSYQWYNNGVLINSTNQITINEETEVELIALSNGCEIVKNFIVSIESKAFNIVVPNTITPNNDGINDTWVITEELAYKNNVEIIIFSSNQQVVYQTKEYQNNWPFETINKSNRVFYYKIIRDNSTIQQGTISVIQ